MRRTQEEERDERDAHASNQQALENGGHDRRRSATRSREGGAPAAVVGRRAHLAAGGDTPQDDMFSCRHALQFHRRGQSRKLIVERPRRARRLLLLQLRVVLLLSLQESRRGRLLEGFDRGHRRLALKIAPGLLASESKTPCYFFVEKFVNHLY